MARLGIRLPFVLPVLAAAVMAVLLSCDTKGTRDGVTPLSPTPTSVTVTFERTGTLVRDNPGLPPGVSFLIYEAPGAPALTVELKFTSNTVCSRSSEPTACGGIQPGTRVHVEGVEVGGAVLVARVEIEDAAAPRPPVRARIFFLDEQRFATGEEPYVVPVERELQPPAVAAAALEALFAGPTPEEEARHLRLVPSGANGARVLRLQDGIAHVELLGGCSSMGSTFTVAQLIIPTLTQFETIDFVKIYDAEGMTAEREGRSNSIPACLEP